MLSNKKKRYKLLHKYRINFLNDLKINFFNNRKWNFLKKRFKKINLKQNQKKLRIFRNQSQWKLEKDTKKKKYKFKRDFRFKSQVKKRFKRFYRFKKRRRNKFKKRIPSQFFRKYKINLSASQNTLKRYFKKSLNQKQFLKHYYGNIKNSQLKSLIQSVLIKKNLKNRYNIIFNKLNNKLDMVVLNMGFVNTMGEAQQLILHKKILLNGKIIKNLNQEIKVNDVISVHPIYHYLVYQKLIYKLYIFNSLFLNDYIQYNFTIKYNNFNILNKKFNVNLFLEQIKNIKPILKDLPKFKKIIPKSIKTIYKINRIEQVLQNKSIKMLDRFFYFTFKLISKQNIQLNRNYFSTLSIKKKYKYLNSFLIDKLYCTEQKYIFFLKNIYLIDGIISKQLISRDKLKVLFLHYWKNSIKLDSLYNNNINKKAIPIKTIFNPIMSLNYKKLNKNLFFIKKDRLNMNKMNNLIIKKNQRQKIQTHLTFFFNFKSIPNYVINYKYLIGIFIKEFTANTLPSYKYLNLSTLIRYYTNYNNF